MNVSPDLVKIQILEKEYMVACPDNERDELRASVDHLNVKMQEIRNHGKVIGTDRMAVMAALNISHELIQTKGREPQHSPVISARIRALQDKIDAALEQSRQLVL
ncbi:MAG: cell division protein ZapA [Gammaproteobacteria bacterium]